MAALLKDQSKFYFLSFPQQVSPDNARREVEKQQMQ